MAPTSKASGSKPPGAQLTHVLVLGVRRIGEHLEELAVAVVAAAVLGWAGACDAVLAAVLAAERGVDAICVSNHGGRQLDGAPATFPLVAVAARATAAMAGRAYLYDLGADLLEGPGGFSGGDG